MNRLSFRILAIAVLVTATVVVAGVSSLGATTSAPAAAPSMLVPF
jgi:hypothetical protein